MIKINKKHTAFITIGCNVISENNPSVETLGSLDAYFDSILKSLPFEIRSKSRTFATEAFPAGSGPDFRNGVVEIITELDPEPLLQRLHEIETEFDRKRPYRWAPRTCDLDILFYDDLISPSLDVWKTWYDLNLEDAQTRTPEMLICPHPRLHERAFVLGPICDIAPDFIHPVLGKTMRKLWGELSENDKKTIKAL